MRGISLCSIAYACLSLSASEARAIPLRNDLGGPLGYGENALPAGDSVWSEPISLRETFPSGLGWYGTRVAAVWVNTNGFVSLAAPFSAETADTPTMFPVAGRPMIAPFWANVSTVGGGQPARNSVWWAVRPDLVAFTWHDVERARDDGLPPDGLTNDFQLLFTRVPRCLSIDYRIEFRFNRIEWTSARAASAPHAIVGFDAGNTWDFVQLPMSRTPAIADVTRVSNVPGGEPGLFRFQTTYGITIGVCHGLGAPCEIPGAVGLCAQGLGGCDQQRSYCRPTLPRRPRCNGQDNDCDGRIDDDDALCAPGTRCDTHQGMCVPTCASDRGCAPEDVCISGRCVRRVCEPAQCPRGEFCRTEQCASPCDGFRCPFGQRCSLGACVDECAAVACPNGVRCVAGACDYGFGCGCYPCPDGGVCGDEGVCVAPSCVGVRCASLTHCVEGRCVDNCEIGAGERVCPPNEVCERGVCVLDLHPRDSGMAIDASAPRDGASSRDATPDRPLDAPSVRAIATPGCSCHTQPSRGSGAWAALALVAWRRRRKP